MLGLLLQVSDAMNSTGPIDIQSYIQTYIDLVDHITNLTGANNVTFDGRNVLGLFDVDMNHIIEGLEGYAVTLENQMPSVIGGV